MRRSRPPLSGRIGVGRGSGYEFVTATYERRKEQPVYIRPPEVGARHSLRAKANKRPDKFLAVAFPGRRPVRFLVPAPDHRRAMELTKSQLCSRGATPAG